MVLLACQNQDPVHIEFALFAGSNWGVPTGDSYRIYDEAIQRFELENPRIKVSYRSGTLREDYSEWLAQRIVRGKDPDVFVVLPEDFNTYAAIGVMEDLDDQIAADPSFPVGGFYRTAIVSGRSQNHQLALPIEIVPNLMFVNTTLLAEAGIPKPKPGWTWADFTDICRKMTRDSDGDGVIDRFGATRISWRYFAFANGLVPFDTNGTIGYFDSPAFIRTITFLADLRKLSNGQREPDFNSGEVAMTCDQFSMYRAYNYWPYSVKRYASFNWEAMEMPKGPDGRNASELSSLLLAIARRSAHKAEAWKFLTFLAADPDIQRSVLQFSYGWPALRRASEGPDVAAMLRRNFSATVGFIDRPIIDQIIEHSVAAPRFKKFTAAMDLADKELYRIIDDPYDLEDRLHKLNRTITNFLK